MKFDGAIVVLSLAWHLERDVIGATVCHLAVAVTAVSRDRGTSPSSFGFNVLVLFFKKNLIANESRWVTN